MYNSKLKKKLKKEVKKILYYNFNWYKGKYLGIHLQGGLCNKLHCLFSACDIAIKENSYLIEPYFGWEKKILFSEMYDLNYFNLQMSEFTNGRSLIVPRDKINSKAKENRSIDNIIDLWEYSEKKLFEERKFAYLNNDSTKLKVLRALKLRPEFEDIVDFYTSNKEFTALQIRTESDWVKYAESRKVNKNEKILVSLEDILTMLSDFDLVGELFFTSGQNHEKISNKIGQLGIIPKYFYEDNYEYEINAAINFEICCKSTYFIGLSRSTYSNLIALKRASLLQNDQSFIYNYKDKILRRKDKGLQVVAEMSLNRKTKIIS